MHLNLEMEEKPGGTGTSPVPGAAGTPAANAPIAPAAAMHHEPM